MEGSNPDPVWVKSWMRPEDVAEVIINLIEEGPDGRTGDNVGLYAGLIVFFHRLKREVYISILKSQQV